MRALLGIERRRGRLFPDFLVAALQRTVAFAEMHAAAGTVAEHLDLDVARLFEILLDVDGVVAEGGTGFRARRLQCDHKIGFAARHLHAASAAAGRRLDDHGVADLGGDASGFLFLGDRPVGAGHHRNAKALCGALGLDLVAHYADVIAGRADESDVVRGEDIGEFGILR